MRSISHTVVRIKEIESEMKDLEISRRISNASYCFCSDFLEIETAKNARFVQSADFAIAFDEALVGCFHDPCVQGLTTQISQNSHFPLPFLPFLVSSSWVSLVSSKCFRWSTIKTTFISDILPCVDFFPLVFHCR